MIKESRKTENENSSSVEIKSKFDILEGQTWLSVTVLIQMFVLNVALKLLIRNVILLFNSN